MSALELAIPRLDAARVEGSIDRLFGYVEEATGWLVFNNPGRRNAVSLEMWRAAPQVLQSFHSDPTVKVIVLVGAGGKAFVAGADISEFDKTRNTAEANTEYRRISGAATAAIEQSPKPTVAMIRGACIGGGLATALSCDLRIASAESRFGIPAARLGIGYPFAGVKRLVDLVGPSRAKHILFTAQHFSAAEAQAMGLINEAVPAEDLEARVRTLTASLAGNAPLSIRAFKLAVSEALKDPADRALDTVNEAVAAAMNSEDFREGQRAFLEKRPPRFQGR